MTVLWWQWLVFGLVLMLAELLSPGGFYIIFFGIAAVVVGLLVGLGLTTDTATEIAMFVVLAVLSGLIAVLVTFAAFCFIAAIWRELSPGAPPPEPDVRQLPRVLLFALNGFLALVALAVLFGVWFGRTGGI